MYDVSNLRANINGVFETFGVKDPAARQAANAAESDAKTALADAKTAGEAVTQLKSAIDEIDDEIFDFQSIDVYETKTDRKLTATGIASGDNTSNLVKYAVSAGDLLYLKLRKDSNAVYQFQTNKSVPVSGTNNYIVGNIVVDAVDSPVKVPDNAIYLIVSQLKTNDVNVVKKITGKVDQINNKIGTSQLETTSQTLTGAINEVNSKFNEIKPTTYISLNLFNPDTAEKGVISTNDGSISPNDKNGYAFVAIMEPGTYATIVNSFRTGLEGALKITYFDENKHYIDNIIATAIGDTSTVKKDQQAKFTVTNQHIAAGLRYVGLNFNWEYRGVLMLVKGDEYPASYIPFYEYDAFAGIRLRPENFWAGCFTDQIIAMHSPLFQKKAVYDGDSICYGEGFAGGYAGIIKNMYSMTMQNNAVSGATITAGTGVSHIISTSIGNLDSDADYVILEGGVNDASISVSAPLGTYSASYTDTFDTETFYGALDTMFKTLVTRFAGKKYGFIITHQMAKSLRWSNEENTSYYWAIVKCCKKWGVPYLDLNISAPPFNLLRDNGGALDAVRLAYTLNGDGWHPNEDGYKKYYVPKIVAWMETL